jgi:membrane peptidoglycan carboxypeptidase
VVGQRGFYGPGDELCDGRGLEKGQATVMDAAKRLGVTADFGPYPHPLVVLGTQEVSPLDITSAHATVANGGRMVDATTISKVVSNARGKDEVLCEGPHEPRGQQVIDQG